MNEYAQEAQGQNGQGGLDDHIYQRLLKERIIFLGSEVRDQNNLSVDQGAYVRNVEDGSAADEAGIRVGDVIVSVDGQAVTSSEDVINAVRRNAPGDTIKVTVDRDGSRETFDVTLRIRPDGA